MSDSKPLRVGIIGAGGNTRLRHLPGFQALDGVEVRALCNRTEASGRKVAEEFGIGRVETHWRALVEAPDIDAICIGTWPYMHAQVTIAALEAGKHVLTEARMASNLFEAKAMQAAAEAHPELVSQIVPAPFSLDCDATVARLARELGQLREVNVIHRFGAGASADSAFNWRLSHELSGKNTHTLGIHYETVQRWLGPSVNPDWLVADAKCFVERRPDGEGGESRVGIPDAVSVLGRYQNGVKFSFEISSVDASPVSEMRLCTEGGTLRFDFSSGKLFLAKPDGETSEVPPDPGTARGWQVEADFVASIREGKAVTLTSFADGLRYMRFTEMVWESWNEGGARKAWPDFA